MNKLAPKNLVFFLLFFSKIKCERGKNNGTTKTKQNSIFISRMLTHSQSIHVCHGPRFFSMHRLAHLHDCHFCNKNNLTTVFFFLAFAYNYCFTSFGRSAVFWCIHAYFLYTRVNEQNARNAQNAQNAHHLI